MIEPGEVIAERYRVRRLLGEGAMGAVYRATQLNLGRAVALKMLTVHREVPDARARLLREARVASALRHPNAVQVHDVGEDRGRPYLVMELLDGYDLRAHVGHGAPPLAISKLLRIARQIASVLVAAHRIGLVHRDLKPENIFLERFEGGERVRVLDFGVAFIADERAVESGRLTQDGVVIGTPFYIAPEQAAGRTVGPAADIYAFGVLLYEMATGRLPFGGTNMEVMAAHMREAPQAPGELRADLPPALEALILAMLRKGPGLRPTAVQVESRLREIDDGRPGAGVEGWEIDPEETTLRGQVLAASAAGLATVRSPVMLRVLLVGEVSAEVAASLQGEGIALERLIDPATQIRGAACVLAVGEPLTAIEGLVRLGMPVIADVERGDVDRSVTLRALGVAARILRPFTATAIAEQVRRVVADDDEGRRTLQRV